MVVILVVELLAMAEEISCGGELMLGGGLSSRGGVSIISISNEDTATLFASNPRPFGITQFVLSTGVSYGSRSRSRRR